MKLRLERRYLNKIKVIYDKLITNITLNREKLKPFLIKTGVRQGYPLFPPST
jgi:hypothetical protein